MRVRYLLPLAALLLFAVYLNIAFGFQAWVYLVALQLGCVPLLLGIIEAETRSDFRPDTK